MGFVVFDPKFIHGSAISKKKNNWAVEGFFVKAATMSEGAR
jgi:hypothetical protein